MMLTDISLDHPRISSLSRQCPSPLRAVDASWTVQPVPTLIYGAAGWHLPGHQLMSRFNVFEKPQRRPRLPTSSSLSFTCSSPAGGPPIPAGGSPEPCSHPSLAGSPQAAGPNVSRSFQGDLPRLSGPSPPAPSSVCLSGPRQVAPPPGPPHLPQATPPILTTGATLEHRNLGTHTHDSALVSNISSPQMGFFSLHLHTFGLGDRRGAPG